MAGGMGVSNGEEGNSGPLSLCQVLAEEYASLRPDPPSDSAITPTIQQLYKTAHESDFSALCLSGGGIRSATFGLGTIQGLAELRLMDELDYLSTVSGGGYIGSWLMAWIHRDQEGARGVWEALRRGPREPAGPRQPAEPRGPAEPRDRAFSEPGPIEHLRSFSNYLSPKPGLLSADTWTLATLYIRNLIVVWLVLGPALGLLLLAPRMVAALLEVESEPFALVAFIGALILGTVAASYASLYQPSARLFLRCSELLKRYENQKWFVRLCLLPMLGSALCFILYASASNAIGNPENSLLRYSTAGAALLFAGWGLAGVFGRHWTWVSMKRLAAELFVMALTGFLLGFLAWLMIRPNSALTGVLSGSRFAILGVPLLLTGYLLTSIAVVGLCQHFVKDYDREWWARLEAWVLIAIVTWVALSGLVLYVPERLESELLVVPFGGISGILTLLIAWSQKSPATTALAPQRGRTNSMRKVVLALAAVLFAAFIIVSIARLTGWVLSKDALALMSTSSDRLSETAQSIARMLPGEEWQNATNVVLLVLVLGIVLLGTNRAIDINKFSLHSIYRNRLIRAYLGASNEQRRANRFTGLDNADNIPINQMRGILLERKDIEDPDALRRKLATSSNPVIHFIRSQLTAEHEFLLEKEPAGKDEKDIERALLEELNARLEDSDLTASPPGKTEKRRLSRAEVESNRDEIARAFGADQIQVKHIRKPLHILNATLNLVAGERLAWQERKAESFTFSVHHCGSCQLDKGRGSYRSSREYLRDPGVPITLGTAAAISGAAASPNMGYHSSRFVGFLMTLLNARLGWWAGNPGVAGNDTYDKAGPVFALRPLYDEALGRTNDSAKYVYLSDGGHFDNLGLYEMVLRRCRKILIIDATADPGYALEGLGNAIRKIRIDMGIPIELSKFFITGRTEDRIEGTHCAIGEIRYRAVDPGAPRGRFIYIKPSIYFHHEPYDIYNYGMVSDTFPHESTRDQWFSEGQFESYRMLGLHIIRTISHDTQVTNWDDFFESANNYIRGFEATKE